jgi:sialate O-acetylesterase
MIADWRSEWGKEFPFYYVQIAPYRYDKPFIGVLVRDAQRKSLCVPNTGMVVTSDIGDTTDIHPRNKRDVGRRLANWALAKTYGKSGIAFCGPMIRGMRPEGGRIRILFDHAEHGLVCRGAELTHFQVAGNDRMFVPARAVIEGGSVVVWSERVKRPAAVRFAWSNTATPNLFNADGLPASCFRTDDWPLDGME